ncbi:MAG: glycoside hydrolase family 26 protein [Chloroflexota bacterium]
MRPGPSGLVPRPLLLLLLLAGVLLFLVALAVAYLSGGVSDLQPGPGVVRPPERPAATPAAQVKQPDATPTPVPPDPNPLPPLKNALLNEGSSIYWGTYLDGVPYDIEKLYQFESRSRKGVSIVHWGQPWMMRDAYQPFPAYEADKVRGHGAIPMINWSSWVLERKLDPSHFRLRDIYHGLHDDYIRGWAREAKAWGHPIFLRFNHEMNGWWYPWSEQAGDNREGDYVKAWRHVHNIFTAVGANNVAWVWSPNVVNAPELTPIKRLYPGDEYVDWLGMDGYNWGTDRSEGWQTFSEVFKATYDQLVALSPGKPLMIGEMSSSEDGGPSGRPSSKAAWIEDAFGEQIPKRFPRIRAVVWFSWNDNNPLLDWAVASSPESVDAFARAISADYYAPNRFRKIGSSDG